MREVPSDFPIVQLDEEAIAHYHKYGYTFIRNYASAEWVEYLRDTLDDRVAHPHFYSFITTKVTKMFGYHQMNPWMSTDGIFNFYIYGRQAQGYITNALANFTSLRLLHDTIDINPTFAQMPIHDDCAPLGRCTDNQMRLFLSVDYVPANNHLHFFLNHTEGRNDPAFGSVDPKWNHRLTPAAELNPGDLLIWNISTLHTSFGTKRRVLTWTIMDGDAPIIQSVGQTWVGLFDTKVFEKQDSFYYPIFYPEDSQDTINERKIMTGLPTLRSVYKFLKSNIKKKSTSIFFQVKEDSEYSRDRVSLGLSVWNFVDEYILSPILED